MRLFLAGALVLSVLFLLSLSGVRAQDAAVKPLQDDKHEETFEAEWVHDTSRANFAGDDVEASLFAATTEDYTNSLGVMATWTIVFGVVLMLFGCAGACVRFIMTGSNDEGASSTVQLAVRIALVVLPVCILIVMIIGIVGNSYMGPGQTFFREQLASEAEDNAQLYTTLVPAVDTTTLGVNWRGSGRSFSATYLTLSKTLVEGDGVGVEDLADEGVDLLARSETGRVVTFAIVWVFAAVGVLISCATAAFAKSELSQATALCSFLLVGCLATNIAGHFVINVVLSDMCFDIRQYKGDEAPKGVLARLNDRFIAEENERVTGEETPIPYVDVVIYDQWCKCPNFNNTHNVISAVRDKLLNDTIVAYNTDPAYNCSSCCSGLDCTACGVATCTSLSNDIILINGTLLDTLTYLHRCEWVSRVFDNRLANSESECDGDECGGLCGTVITGLVMIYVTSFVMGILFCILGCVGIYGDQALLDSGYS
jgi:hypothetical protein